MNDFSFTRVDNVSDGLKMQATLKDSKFVAGGTNLLDLMKEGVTRASGLIQTNDEDLRKVSALHDGSVRLGSMMTNAETARHSIVRTKYPLLSEAILAGASPQLRNMATNGGNLLQRTRCYYFYDVATPCNKREPGTGCSAIGGINRIHAILGASDHCIAVHPSDMCVALTALNARVVVESANGTRTIAVRDFHRLPGDFPQLDTVMEIDEFIIGIELPEESFSSHYAYIKARERNSYAFALVSCAVALQIEGGKILDARLALGGVAHKPWRADAADQCLRGAGPRTEVFARAADLLLEGAEGQGDNDFKIPLAKKCILQALTEAAERSPRHRSPLTSINGVAP